MYTLRSKHYLNLDFQLIVANYSHKLCLERFCFSIYILFIIENITREMIKYGVLNFHIS